MTSHDERREKTPLKLPEKVDRSWSQKIEKAKEAREAGRKQRQGKPSSFRRAVGRTAS